MKLSPYLVHEAMQNAPVDDKLYRQSRAAIADVLTQLRAKFEFVSKGCHRPLDPITERRDSVYGFCSLDHRALCNICVKDQPQ